MPLATLRTLLGALLLAALGPAFAAPNEDQAREAVADAEQAARKGPVDIELAGQAVLRLPARYQFVPQPQAMRLLNAMGNPGQDRHLQGVIFPDGDQGWFMPVRYEASGHVKDDDARDWNADELLDSYKQGTEAANEQRLKMGVPAIEIQGWIEKPAYDSATHRLVWAMSSREKGSPADAPQGVNYNTYALGREGYFSLNLVTALADLHRHKSVAQTMLSALGYNEGRRYADFDAKTDHVAEYGLAALVVGVAAKKLGFIALALAFFAKFAKLILIGLAVFGAGFMKFLRRKKTAPAVAAAPAEPPSP